MYNSFCLIRFSSYQVRSAQQLFDQPVKDRIDQVSVPIRFDQLSNSCYVGCRSTRMAKVSVPIRFDQLSNSIGRWPYFWRSLRFQFLSGSISSATGATPRSRPTTKGFSSYQVRSAQQPRMTTIMTMLTWSFSSYQVRSAQQQVRSRLQRKSRYSVSVPIRFDQLSNLSGNY